MAQNKKRRYAVIDAGDILNIYMTEKEACNKAAEDEEVVEMIENYFWIPSDWTDPEGTNWIFIDRHLDEMKRLIKSTGMTQRAIAGLLNVHANTVHYWTSGKNDPPEMAITQLQSLARQNITGGTEKLVSEILSLDPDSTPPAPINIAELVMRIERKGVLGASALIWLRDNIPGSLKMLQGLNSVTDKTIQKVIQQRIL